MSTPLRPVKIAIAIPLIASIVSWGLFLAAQYADLVQQSQLPSPYDPDAPEPFRVSTWLLFAASAVFGISSLIAQRRSIALRAQLGARNELARAAHRFTNLTVIVALALATLLAITAFFTGFLSSSSDNSSGLVRIVNAYAPIVVYTALVVTLLLGAFVFRKSTVPPVDADTAASAERASGASTSSRLSHRGELGLAYASPIVLTAIALILGLIVFDVTGTAPEVVVWVTIQALIGTGIVLGTVLARRAHAGFTAEPDPAVSVATAPEASRSAISGARALNFVLSIVFGVVVTIMSLSYGSSAMSSLSISPSLWVEVYPGGDVQQNGEVVSADDLVVSLYGFGLDRGSPVTVTLEPGGVEVLADTVDRDGAIFDQEPLPSTLESGEYTITAVARTADAQVVTTSTEFTITTAGDLRVGAQDSDFGTDTPRLISPTTDWILNDFVPALLLLLLACAGIATTLIARNREVARPAHAPLAE